MICIEFWGEAGKKMKIKPKWIGMMMVPIALAMVLVPFSMLVGWNLLTLISFWFVLVPTVAVYAPKLARLHKNGLFESLVGLLIFYAIVIFLIYEHYGTDYFQVMMLSLLINLISIFALTRQNVVQKEKKVLTNGMSNNP